MKERITPPHESVDPRAHAPRIDVTASNRIADVHEFSHPNVVETEVVDSPTELVHPNTTEASSHVAPSKFDTFMDAVKLHTVDKWTYAFSRAKEKFLHGRDAHKAAEHEYHSTVAARRLDSLRELETKEASAFNNVIGSLQTPEMKALMERHREARLAKLKAAEQPYTNEIAEHAIRVSELKEKRDKFAERIAAIEDKYTQRINERITAIKQEMGYDKEERRNTTLRAKKEQVDREVEKHRQMIADLNILIKGQRVHNFSKQEIQSFKTQIAEMTEALNEEHLKNRDFIADKLEVSDAKMAKMNKRLLKWEKKKPRYKDTATDEFEVTENVDESDNHESIEKDKVIMAQQLNARIEMFLSNLKQFSKEDWNNALHEIQKRVLELQKNDPQNDVLSKLVNKLQDKELKYLSKISSSITREFELKSLHKLVGKYTKAIVA